MFAIDVVDGAPFDRHFCWSCVERRKAIAVTGIDLVKSVFQVHRVAAWADNALN